MFDQPFPNGRNVPAHCELRLRPILARLLDRIHQCIMRIRCAAARNIVRLAAEQPDLILDILQHVAQPCIARRLGNRRVETHIFIDILRPVVRFQISAQPFVARPQFFNQCRWKVARAHRMNFQCFPNIVKFVDLLVRKAPQIRASTGFDADQSFRLQAVQRLPDRRFADAQLSGQKLLGQPRLLVETPLENVLLDALVRQRCEIGRDLELAHNGCSRQPRSSILYVTATQSRPDPKHLLRIHPALPQILFETPRRVRILLVSQFDHQIRLNPNLRQDFCYPMIINIPIAE